MISLEQIQKLEARVGKAVELIRSLRQENASLTRRLGEYQTRIDELEVLIGKFKQDQGEIEKGIMSALEQLDALEDGLSSDEPISAQPDPTPEEPEEQDTVTGEAGDASAQAGEPDSELDIF
jgi:chromosome segregation ATPase